MNARPFATQEFAQALRQRAGQLNHGPAPVARAPFALQLAQQKRALRRTQSGAATGVYDRFVVQRGNLSNIEFADFMVKTRQAITTLDTGFTGHRMLSQTNQRLAMSGGNVFIRHSNATNDASPNVAAANRFDSQNAMYRQADDQRGVGGIGTTVNWNPENRRVDNQNRPAFIGLGHELVHAWRNAHGATLFRRSAADLFAGGLSVAQQRARAAERAAAMGMDEGQTVGLSRLIHEWMPTENALRLDHNVAARRNYGDYWVNGFRQF